ncbi:MAG: repressor LexA [Myxococcales bacterium]|nr:repressor LexA [Myxococcales bacterium]
MNPVLTLPARVRRLAGHEPAAGLLRPVGRPVKVPLVGIIAAGRPVDAVEVLDEDALIDIPASYLSTGEHFALRVVGDSMIEDGICDGDLILVRKQDHAESGQTVIALTEGEATVKKLYYHGDQVELRPANAAMQSFFLPRGRLVIQGLVISLLRRY